MGRGKSLTDVEIGQILAYHDQGKSGRWIGNKIGRSKSLVNDFLKDPEQYGQAKHTGRPKVITDRESRHVLRLITDENMSCPEAKRQLELTCHRSTVYRNVRDAEHVDFKKANHKPPLTKEHRIARLNFAREHIDFGDKWLTVMFSDEKKFNLDGPDGFHRYWHDLGKEEQIFSKRQFGGGSVMIWAGICFNGTTDIAFLDTSLNSEGYQEVLDHYLVPVFYEMCGTNGIFQQDNAPIHTSTSTKQWFSDKCINLMKWPARSPDVSPIENVWGNLARRVYQYGRQFNSKNELKSSIVQEWNRIDQTEI